MTNSVRDSGTQMRSDWYTEIEVWKIHGSCVGLNWKETRVNLNQVVLPKKEISWSSQMRNDKLGQICVADSQVRDCIAIQGSCGVCPSGGKAHSSALWRAVEKTVAVQPWEGNKHHLHPFEALSYVKHRKCILHRCKGLHKQKQQQWDFSLRRNKGFGIIPAVEGWNSQPQEQCDPRHKWLTGTGQILGLRSLAKRFTC